MRIYGDWFEKLKSSNDIFEFRVKDSNKFFRLFAFWDSSGDAETLIVCTHGLIKKTNKTSQLGELIGVKRAQISKLEHGNHSASVSTIMKVFQAM